MLAPEADVIVIVDSELATSLDCLRSALRHGGPTLRRLIVIEDHGSQSGLCQALDRLAAADDRVHRVKGPAFPLGYADSCNRGLLRREGDAVLLGSNCIVGRDWLSELAEVAHSEERTACSAPLNDAPGTCSVAGPDDRPKDGPPDDETVRAACAGLPRWTVAPVLSGSCIYLRGDAIDAVGLLDPTIASADEAIDDWVTRAQTLGFMAKRANHAYVRRVKSATAEDGPAASPEPAPAAAVREPHLRHQLERFGKTLDGHLAGHAVRLESTRRLRVAYDIRHLPREQVGTRTYAVSLARALAGLREVDLTLLVADPAQANGLKGRVVTEDQWKDDVAVIHKPSQVVSPHDLVLLFGSSAHVVVSYQDLIGYRIPLAFPSDREFDDYRATSTLSLQAVQRVIAISENVGREIQAEFGIPPEDVPVVPHGVDAGWFAHRGERDVAIAWRMGLPGRYFLSLATDFPHKNLSNLLDAYALLRSRWRDDEPPGLVLAGYASGARTGFYRKLQANGYAEGLRVLGPVSHEELRVLYQNAETLVYPSLYEGFGLPPLEAMAAGTPVIAMPFSAVPEVCGDCVLYPDGLSTNDLTRAMERLAADADLREDLRARGWKRVEQFRWELTARRTCEVYRSAVLRPSDRSLRMRRYLREAIVRWGSPVQYIPAPPPPAPPPPPPLGILNSLTSLNAAISRRLRSEVRRFRPRFPAGRPHVAIPAVEAPDPISHDPQPADPPSPNPSRARSARLRADASPGSGTRKTTRRSLANPISKGRSTASATATGAQDVTGESKGHD